MARSAKQTKPRLVSDSDSDGGGVGAILRGARLARGEELREVSSALRIRLPYLEALENGEISELPGMTYGIGFVRAYAEHLDLDSADMISRFKVEARSINRRTELQFPEPLPSNRVPSAALLLVVLLLAGGVYGGWLYSTSQNMTLVEAIEQVPDRLLGLGDEGDASPSPASSATSSGETTSVAPDVAATDPSPTPVGTEEQATASPEASAVDSEDEAASVDAVATQTPGATEDGVTEDRVTEDGEPEVGATEDDAGTTAGSNAPAPQIPEVGDELAEAAEDETAGAASDQSDAVAVAEANTPEEVSEPAVEALAAAAPEVETTPADPQPDSAAQDTSAAAPAAESDETASLDPTGQDVASGVLQEAEGAVEEAASITPAPTSAQTSEAAAPTEASPTAEPDVSTETPAEEAPAETTATVPAPAEIVEETLPPPTPESTAADGSVSNAGRAEIAEEDLPPPALEPSVEAEVAATEATPPPVDTPEATSSAEPESAATPPARARIILQATSESWIRVTTPDGDVLVEKLLLMGEIYRVPNREGLLLDTGNAGALKILVDGRPAPLLGEEGEIQRNIPLVPDTLIN